MSFRSRSCRPCLFRWSHRRVCGCSITGGSSGCTCSWKSSGEMILWGSAEPLTATFRMTSCGFHSTSCLLSLSCCLFLLIFNLFSYICEWILLMRYSSAPSGMIESTPFLFGNAWRVSSACVPRPSLPQLDPCDTHQQAGDTFTLLCITLYLFRLLGLNVFLCDFSLLCSGEVWRADARGVFCLSWVCESSGFSATVSCRRL